MLEGESDVRPVRTGDIKLRKLADADAGAWWRLRLEALQTEPLAFGPTVEEHRQLGIEEVAEWIRETGGGFTLGAFDGERLVAMATFQRETAAKERHKAHLRRVYVSGAYRGIGLGKRLIAAVLEIAQEDTSLEQVMLAVGTHNAAAIHTYRKLGFEVYGTEPHALKAVKQYVDEHLMVLRIGGEFASPSSLAGD